MSKELDALIKRERGIENPTVATPLVELYEKGKALELTAVLHRTKIKKMTLKVLDTNLRELLEALDTAERMTKQYAKSPHANLKLLAPVGIQRVIDAMRRFAKDLYTCTVAAGAAERLKLSETVSFIDTSFPLQNLTDMLMSNEARVTQVHLKARLGADKNSDKTMKRVADKFKKTFNKLPTSLGGKMFTAFEMPVVPLFADMSVQIDPAVLTRVGMKVTQIGDAFLVLDRQMLLAFDHKAMGWKSKLRTTATGTRAIYLTGPKAAARSAEQVDDVNEVLQQINAKSSTQYELGSTIFIANPRAPSMWLAWIMPAAQRKRMQNEMRTTEVQWDLPFSRHYNVDED